MGGSSHSMPADAAKGDVNVTLGDMWVKADRPEVKAGKVTFAVKQMAAPSTAWPSRPPRSSRAAGCSTRPRCSVRARSSRAASPRPSTVDLEPGAYELACFMPGHYAAGQKLPFTVK